MNIIFKNWLDINRESSSESLNSEECSKKSIPREDLIEKEILNLKKELEKTERINFNLKITIDKLDKKIKKLNNENKYYKDASQIILFFSVICNIYFYLKK